ncbi:Heavy metal translocating P-type ATPase [Bacillus mycoides]|nr:Heavy metal translocating P-type ATPase [Bacillus mycoides]EEL05370.1 Heavy metal translocating P-type ATPase [Bacillus cereus BDRD-ST196]
MSLQQEEFDFVCSFSKANSDEQQEELFSIFVESLLLLQQEVSFVIGIIGISFFEEQHDEVSFVISSFIVVFSPLQQEDSLAIGTIGISFFEEQHDEVCFSFSFLSVMSVFSFLR